MKSIRWKVVAAAMRRIQGSMGSIPITIKLTPNLCSCQSKFHGPRSIFVFRGMVEPYHCYQLAAIRSHKICTFVVLTISLCNYIIILCHILILCHSPMLTHEYGISISGRGGGGGWISPLCP